MCSLRDAPTAGNTLWVIWLAGGHMVSILMSTLYLFTVLYHQNHSSSGALSHQQVVSTTQLLLAM